MDIAGLVEQLAIWLDVSKYLLLFTGSFLEGTTVMLTGGILWHEGLVAFAPTYFALIAGDVLSDVMWYALGYWGGHHFVERWGHLVNATPEVMEKARRYFQKYHARILIISKLTMGLGFSVPILITLGLLRMSFTQYLLITTIGSFVWVGGVMVVGSLFGNVVALVPAKLQIALLLAGFVGFIFGLRALSNRISKLDL